MIFGIDFGTTYTIVSWYDKEYKFLYNNGSVLFKTQINGHENIKLKIANNEENAFELGIKFFKYIKNKIDEQVLTSKDEIKNCVLTVPIRFDDKARNMIKSCAILNGFNVLKLLSEPVAAAIYAVQEKKNGYYLVYDLGGGTFDLSLLKLQDDVFHIIAVDGLKDYGGINIDALIAHELNCTLLEAIRIKESGIWEKNLEEKIAASLKKTYEMVFALLNANDIHNLNGLILAGGSSQIYLIEDFFKNYFHVLKDDAPSEMVAKGAAKHAYSLMHDNHLLIDVVPFHLGVEVLGEKMEIIIPKNSPIPFMQKQWFKKANSSNVLINILQGVNENKNECSVLATIEIDCEDEFEITFMVDCDGIIAVKIEDQIINLAMLSRKIEPNIEIKNIYNLIAQMNGLNKEQQKFMAYIKQAMNEEISNEALNWLKDKYIKLFVE